MRSPIDWFGIALAGFWLLLLVGSLVAGIISSLTWG